MGYLPPEVVLRWAEWEQLAVVLPGLVGLDPALRLGRLAAPPLLPAFRSPS